jgi:hypothetical protein
MVFKLFKEVIQDKEALQNNGRIFFRESDLPCATRLAF